MIPVFVEKIGRKTTRKRAMGFVLESPEALGEQCCRGILARQVFARPHPRRVDDNLHQLSCVVRLAVSAY